VIKVSVGEKLKEARLNQGITLQMVEDETKIRKFYLESLEKGRYEALPPEVYAVGFMKRYAKFLGLNEREIVEEFKQEAYRTESEDEFVFDEPQKSIRRIALPWKNIAAGVLFLVLVIWLGGFVVDYISDYATRPTPIQPPTVTEITPPAEEPPAEPIAELVVKAIQSCWLNVIVDEEPAFTGILSPGEERIFTGKKKVFIKAGNSGGINLNYNGKDLGVFGQNGEVKEIEFIAK